VLVAVSAAVRVAGLVPLWAAVLVAGMVAESAVLSA